MTVLTMPRTFPTHAPSKSPAQMLRRYVIIEFSVSFLFGAIAAIAAALFVAREAQTAESPATRTVVAAFLLAPIAVMCVSGIAWAVVRRFNRRRITSVLDELNAVKLVSRQPMEPPAESFNSADAIFADDRDLEKEAIAAMASGAGMELCATK